MTDTYDTAELKRLMEAATPGPWVFHDLRAEKDWEGEQSYSISVGLSFVDDARYYPSAPSFADAALIVAAVNALPDLLARVEAAEMLADHAEAMMSQADDGGYTEIAATNVQHSINRFRALFKGGA